MYSKTNAPYLIAGALACIWDTHCCSLCCISSPIAALGIPLPVILTLFVLSAIVIAISCKMIKKIEVEKNKFAEKEQELESVKQQLESKVQELENEITLGKEAANKEVEELKNQLNRLTREKQDADRVIEGLNKEMEWLEDPQEELYDASEGKGGDKNKNEEIEKEIERLKACHNMTSRSDLHKQNEKHSSENSNIDKALFDKSLKAEEKFNESINKCEERLNMLEQNLLQGKTVQEIANLLEMIKGLSSEHSSEFEGTGENTSANEQSSKPKSPYISAPIRPPYKELNDASCDSGYFSGCSTTPNSY